jgi:hypothetical protein
VHDETTSTVGEQLSPVGLDPGAQGFQGRSAQANATAMVIVGAMNNIANWSTEYAANDEWEKTRPDVQKHLNAEPWLGVLIVFAYTQGSAPITMQAPKVFQWIATYYGETAAEAQALERKDRHIYPGGLETQLLRERRWIDPPVPGSKPKPKPRATSIESSGPKNATELDGQIATYVASNNWNQVALSLNGFSNEDIKRRVTSDTRLTSHRRDLMRGALDTMILWPPRKDGVTDAIYDADPAAARQGRIDFVNETLDTGRGGEPPRNFGSEMWKKAALGLNGFSDADIRQFIPRDLEKCKLIRDECIKLGWVDRVKKAIEDSKPSQDWSLV